MWIIIYNRIVVTERRDIIESPQAFLLLFRAG